MIMYKDDTSAWVLAGIFVCFFIISSTVQLKYQHDALQELQKQTDILMQLKNQQSLEASLVCIPTQERGNEEIQIPTKDHHE